MIRKILKEGTAELHDSLEAISFSKNIMDGSLTLEEYTTILKCQYIGHQILEPIYLKQFSGDLAAKLEIENRMKIDLLVSDLAKVGINASEIEIPQIDTNIDSLAAAIGALYVTEGSTLGGMYILKSLKRNPQLAHISEFNFYQCYGDNARYKWNDFVEILEAYSAENPDKDQEILESSKNTFALFTEIFKQAV